MNHHNHRESRIENPVIYMPIRHSADQGTNIRLRLRCSFRLLSFGYVLNDDLRLTQPTRAVPPLHEIPLYICREPSTNQPFLCKTNPILSAVGGLQMDVNLYNTTDYERKRNWTLGENKPNSNPNKPNFKRAKMNINSIITKDYRKKDDFLVRINKPNLVRRRRIPKMNINLYVTKDYEE